MTRQLHTRVTFESADDLLKTFRSDLGVEYVFHREIRWWQFWRWPWIVREDYQLSRAAEIILARQMSVSMSAAIAKDLVESITEASDLIHEANEEQRKAKEKRIEDGEELERCVNCGSNLMTYGVCGECGFGHADEPFGDRS